MEKELLLLHEAARATGCDRETPFLLLAFLPLPVIPFRRRTDQGWGHVGMEA